MPAKAAEIALAASRLGFRQVRQRGSHAIYRHADGRRITIPVHGSRDIGGRLFHDLLKQLGITEEQFRDLR